MYSIIISFLKIPFMDHYILLLFCVYYCNYIYIYFNLLNYKYDIYIFIYKTKKTIINGPELSGRIPNIK